MEKLKEEEHLTVGATIERSFSGGWSTAITVFCVLAVVYFALYNGHIIGRLGLYISLTANGAFCLGMVTILALLFRSPVKQKKVVTNHLPWYDIILILAAMVSFFYPMFFFHDYHYALVSGYLPTPLIVLTILAIISLLEAGRRVLGLIFPLLVLVVIIYLFLTEYAPGFLQMHDIELPRIAWMLYGVENGLFSIAMRVAGTVIVMFVIFSAFLQYTRAGEFFINLALVLLGRVRGGAAKAAVVGSSLFGTFSGSPSANAAAVGTVTIPLMKSIGYAPEFAAGVEAVASTGGQIMPPVMGAVAFIMSDWLGIPYLSICIAAAVPAILYYLAVFIAVDAQAVKLGLHGLPREKLPKLWPVLKNGWYWFLPILVILITLAGLRYDPARCAFIALLSIFPLTFLKGEKRFNLKSLAQTCRGSMMTMMTPGLACGLAGAIIGSVSLSGVGIKLSSMIVYFAGGNTVLLLVMAAFAALILGTGLPAIPVYIVVVVLVAPALKEMGIPLFASHMFVFYWGMISFITPPECVAVYVSSAIARCSPWQASFWACRMGIVAFLIPFGMVYNPGILLSGPPMYLLQTVILALAGTVAIAFGISSHALTRVNWLQSILFVVGGFLMYLPNWWLFIPGLTASAIALLWNTWQWKRVRAIQKQMGISPEMATGIKG